ncbi:DedA family protein [Candidatus Peregrinibacteria bacterium]|nr:DedA family protein [Candidatus Peregrinibacteria bacterium]
MDGFIQTLLGFTQDLGYTGIFLLMTVESSFVPFPSEVVIPPAAYLAAKGEFNLIFIIVFGVFGSLAGALINYYLAYFLGRPLVYILAEKKWAKYLLINRKKVEKAEHYFLKYGNLSTFIGRLLPGIRQMISLPAGFVKMPIWPFIFYTILGSGVWVTFLAVVSYVAGLKL